MRRKVSRRPGLRFPPVAEQSEVMDHIIATQEFQVERKHLTVQFRENERGRFLRICEEAHGRRNTIIIPSTGIGDFTDAITRVLTEAQNLTPA